MASKCRTPIISNWWKARASSPVLAFKGQTDAVEAALKALPGVSPRKVGPGEWLVVTSNVRSASARSPAQWSSTRSHARTHFRLKGPHAVRILMKGVGVDLPGGAVPIGASAMMAFQHLTVNLARTGDDAFELIVLRSFAESLYHDLRLAGREFSLSIRGGGTLRLKFRKDEGRLHEPAVKQQLEPASEPDLYPSRAAPKFPAKTLL